MLCGHIFGHLFIFAKILYKSLTGKWAWLKSGEDAFFWTRDQCKKIHHAKDLYICENRTNFIVGLRPVEGIYLLHKVEHAVHV